MIWIQHAKISHIINKQGKDSSYYKTLIFLPFIYKSLYIQYRKLQPSVVLGTGAIKTRKTGSLHLKVTQKRLTCKQLILIWCSTFHYGSMYHVLQELRRNPWPRFRGQEKTSWMGWWQSGVLKDIQEFDRWREVRGSLYKGRQSTTVKDHETPRRR